MATEDGLRPEVFDPSCTFCLALRSHREGKSKPHDTILYTSPRFVVLPALGPIVPGHVVVVSRNHTPSLLSSGSEMRREYDALLSRLRVSRPFLRSGLLEAEHGSTASERAGACITHTHVNLIPNLGHLDGMFDGEFPLEAVANQVASLQFAESPYLLLRGGDDYKVYLARNIASQLIRRRLCTLLGRDDWDWAVFPSDDVISETIGLWRGNDVSL
jgi:diadenosine tetraphosphate (Ap4A) HIT family hydrolase